MGRKNRRTQKEKIDYSLVSQKKAAWCIDNGYKIYPVPAGKCFGRCTEFYVIVQRGVQKEKSKKVYTDIGVANKTWELYNFFYDKHADR
jgi:hypothetical protein